MGPVTVVEQDEGDGRFRTLDPFQDLEAIVELIDLAFGDKLDPVAKATLARMRQFARGGVLVQWLWAIRGMAAVSPGLVWVEGGRVVGNVSLRRARRRGGYLIGNVVVHPDWRRRGIATAMMEAALRVISEAGGRWVGLEVRADNVGAQKLYAGLGFLEVGRTLHLLRPEGVSYERRPLPDGMRRATSKDGDDLVGLVRAVISEEQRPLLEVQESEYRPHWVRWLRFLLCGETEQWWVARGTGGIAGAVRAVRERGAFPNRLEILVRPGAEDVGRPLVQRGVASLRGSPGKPIAVALPTGLDLVVTALEDEGFDRTHTLVQMKRGLIRPIRVKSREAGGLDEVGTGQGSGAMGEVGMGGWSKAGPPWTD